MKDTLSSFYRNPPANALLLALASLIGSGSPISAQSALAHGTAVALAGTAQTAPLEFEVATIKPSKPGTKGKGIGFDGHKF